MRPSLFGLLWGGHCRLAVCLSTVNGAPVLAKKAHKAEAEY